MTRAVIKGSGNDGKQLGKIAALAEVKPDSTSRIKTLYRIMQSVEGRLGGGEGVEGLYGSITCSGMQRIVAALETHCRMGADSCLVDVGAGLGRPLLHAMLAAGLTSSYGVEIDAIKCQKASAFLAQTRTELIRRGALPPWFTAVPKVSCSAIEQVRTLDPATHAYSFWEGVPGSGKRAFGRLVAASPLLQGVAVVQRAIRAQQPAAAMAEMGFGDLCLVDSFPVSMSGDFSAPEVLCAIHERLASSCPRLPGSGRSFRAYIFRRVPPPAVALAAAQCVVAVAAATAHANEKLAAQLVEMAATQQLKPHNVEQAVTPTAAAAAAAAVAAGRSTRALARSARRAARSAVQDAEQACNTGPAAAAVQPAGDDADAVAGAPACQQDAAVVEAPPQAAAARLDLADTAAQPHSAPSGSGAAAETSAAAAVVDDDGGSGDAAADEVQSAPAAAAAAAAPAKRTSASAELGRRKCPRSPEKGSPSSGRQPQRPEAPPPPRQGTLWGHVRSHPRSGSRSVKAQLFSGAPPGGLRVEDAADAPETH